MSTGINRASEIKRLRQRLGEDASDIDVNDDVVTAKKAIDPVS